MKNDMLSLRQVMALLFTALLAPTVDLLPTFAAQTAGRGGWVLPLGALVLLLPALWAWEGFSALSKTGVHTIIYIMYMLLIVLLLAVSFRRCAFRLELIYGKGPAFVAAAALLAAAVWMGWGKTAAFARAGEIFYLAISVVLVGVVVLGLFQVDQTNLDLAAVQPQSVLHGSVLTAGIILNVYPVCVLGNKVKKNEGNKHRAIGWAIAYCVVAALVLAAIIGCIGPELAGELPSPFLIVVQGIGIDGAFQRMEALVATLWALADFTLIGLLLHSWRNLAYAVSPGKWGKWSMCGTAGVALLIGGLAFRDQNGLHLFSVAVLPVTGLMLGLIFPLIFKMFYVLGRCGKRR